MILKLSYALLCVKKNLRTIPLCRSISALNYLSSSSRFGKDIKDFEGGNIPPQRPLACSPQVQEQAEHRRFAPQTVYFSFSSTRRLVKVASIRLLQGMSFGIDVIKRIPQGNFFRHCFSYIVFRISYIVKKTLRRTTGS